MSRDGRDDTAKGSEERGMNPEKRRSRDLSLPDDQLRRVMQPGFAQPGKYELTLDIVKPDDPRHSHEILPGKTYGTWGYTLEQLRSKLGGSTGVLTAPDGTSCQLSLSDWDTGVAGARYYPTFIWVPENDDDAAIVREVLSAQIDDSIK